MDTPQFYTLTFFLGSIAARLHPIYRSLTPRQRTLAEISCFFGGIIIYWFCLILTILLDSL